ncbi:MAG: response regulator transcription factor [Chloroflexota bacterium]
MDHTYILVVDDDEKILKFLRYNLAREGWHILTARDGAEALQVVEREPLDLILLDIMLPRVDGFEVCRRLRQFSHVPIIGLSARGDVADKVRCLNLGADDYITKPFGVDELIARIKAVLRRNKVDDAAPAGTSFQSGDLEIDFVARRVTVAGREVRLTPTEFKLLRELVLGEGQALSHRHLLGKIWGPEYKTEREYLHVYIGHLRTKLEADPKNPRYILSVPGVGYRFQNNY